MRATEILNESYIAFELDGKSRRTLAQHFIPKYPDFIGNHITYKLSNKKDKIPSMPKSVEVIGYADDGEGLEALVVAINGKTTRPDGKIYHITWSLDRSKGRKPQHSNMLIAEKGYEDIEPISINAKPGIF